MIFKDVSAYMNENKRRPIPALPIPLVAEHLGITSAAVMGRAHRGKLELLEIGKTKMVLVRSLLALKEEREWKVMTVREELKRVAGRGERRVFYEPIMKAVGLDWRVPAHRREIGGILGDLSVETYKMDDLLLSVLVHQKKAGRTMPGAGFFDLAEGLGLTWQDEHLFVEGQTDKVMAKFGPD